MEISALNKLAFVVALRMGQFVDAEPYLARAERMAQQFDDAAGYAEMSVIRCQMCTVQADFDGVIRHMSEVTAISERLGIAGNLAVGLEHISGSMMYLTRFEEAETIGQKALEAARAVSDREHEAWVQALTLPICRICHGDIDGAREFAAEGTQIATRIGSLPPQIFGNWLLAELARWQGEYELALFYGQRSLQAALPLEPFMPFMVVQPLGSLGMVYLDISPHFMDRISEFHRHAWNLLETPGGSGGGGTAWADLGWCALTLGDVEIAAECFEKGLSQRSIMMWVERPRYLAGAAMVASKQGRLDDAMSLIEEGCAYVEERGMRYLFPLMRLTAGRIHNDWGDYQQALAHLEIAETLATEMKLRPILWQTQLAAAGTLEVLERHIEAAQKRLAAQAVIQTIAALFEDDALRQVYLDRFRSVMTDTTDEQNQGTVREG
jgi:tetratricopeptide (TPR) repeat protein